MGMSLAAHGNSLCSRYCTTIYVIRTTLILALCLFDGMLGIYSCFWFTPALRACLTHSSAVQKTRRLL